MNERYLSLDDIPPARNQVLWIIFAQVLILIPHITHIPSSLFGISLGLMLLASWLTWKQKILPRLFRIMLVFAGFAAVLFYFGAISGRDPGVSLLSIMLALKLLEIRTRRDASIAVFLGYFLVITQFLFSQAMPLIIYLFGTTLLLTSVLIGLTDLNRDSTVKGRLHRSLRLLIQSIPFMLVLFLLFPRIHAPMWGFTTKHQSAVTGLGESMSPGQFSDLIQSNQLAFRAVFDEQIPQPEERYWRGPVLWDFDGREWTRGTEFKEPRSRRVYGDEQVDYRLLMEPSDRPWVLGLDLTARYPGNLRLTHDYRLISPLPIREFTEFRLSAFTSYIAGEQLSAEERSRALSLPSGISPQAYQLGQSWKTSQLSPEAIVSTALSMIRNGEYSYTLRPPLYLDDPIDEFLFEGRQGFCEHYSGAFVFLMRAAGIPARVVTGYLGGEYNPGGDYLMIRQSDAHAWTEIWLDNRGWIRIDPTAAIAPERIESGLGDALSDSANLPFALQGRYSESLLHRLSLIYDSVDYYWNFWILGFGPERQRELARLLGLGNIDWQDMILLIIALMGGLILIFMAIFLIRLPRPKVDPAISAFRQFKKKLGAHGVTITPGTGPKEMLQRIQVQSPQLLGQAESIIDRYIAIRYADSATDQTLSELRRNIRQFAKKNPPKRVS
jgi:transglutaminase-like putative cysteine protease